jgi:hypothetical protein
MAKNQKKSPMKLSQQFPTRTSPSWRPLIYFVLIVLGYTALFRNQQKPQPLRITRTLGTSTQPVEVLWSREDIPTLIASDGEGIAYATRLFGKNSLIVFDAMEDRSPF